MKKQGQGGSGKAEKAEKLKKIRPNTQGSYFSASNYQMANRRQKDEYSNSDSVFSGNYLQEHVRRVENGRLLKSLINPKRDKLIVNSLENVRLKGKETSIIFRKSHHTSGKGRKNKRRECPLNPKSFQQFQLRMENERMGMRIMNTKSTGYSFPLDGEKIKKKNSNYRINKGVHSFFKTNSRIQNSRQLAKSQTVSFLKPYYGYGPTLICLSSISLNLLPAVKDDDLISLELMIKGQNENIYRTPGIPYGILRKIQIKFAVRIKKIGEYVPLRFWKFHEVESIELGIIDIQFGRYQRKDDCLFQSSQNVVQCVNRQGKKRTVVSEKLQVQLRKSLMEEVAGEASLEYEIYSKRYS